MSFARQHGGYVIVVHPGAGKLQDALSILWPAGHRIESTVRYLGVEIDDALDIAEKIEI